MDNATLVSQPLFLPGRPWGFIGLHKAGAILPDTSPTITGLRDPTKTRLGTAGWWAVQTTRRQTIATADTEGGTRPLDNPTFKMLQLYAADMFTLYAALAQPGLLESVGVKIDAPDGLQSPTPFAWTDTMVPGKVVAGATLVTETRAALLAVVNQGIHQARSVLVHIDKPETTTIDTPVAVVIDTLSEGMNTIKAVLKPAVLAVNTLQSNTLAKNSSERHHELEPASLAAIANFVTALRFFAHTMHGVCVPPAGTMAATSLRTGLLTTLALYSGTQAARTYEDEDDVDESATVVSPEALSAAVGAMVGNADKALVLMTRANTTLLPESMRCVATNTARALCWLKGFALCISSLATDASRAATCHANLLEIKGESTPLWRALVTPGIGTCKSYCETGFLTPGTPSEASEAWLTKRATPETQTSPTALEKSLEIIQTIVRCRRVTIADDVYSSVAPTGK